MKNLLLILIVILYIQCNTSGNMDSNNDEKKKRIDAKRNIYLNKIIKKPNEQVSSSIDPSIQNEKEKYETLTGIKSINTFFEIRKLKWIKNKSLNIKGLDNKPIKKLEGKLKYSYSISPIKENSQFTEKIMPVVIFQTTKNEGQDLEVTNFSLTNNPELDFNYRRYPVYKWWSAFAAPRTEASQEPGFVNTNTFWIAGQNAKTIPALTQDEYIQAKIQVKNNKDKTTNEYEILLDTTYLVRLIQDTINQYPEISKIAPDFKL
ncbi:p23 cell envelope protein (plasmid) [Borrelia miyamotoi]|uniref:BB0158 famile outer surface lipoprotein n=1 Tax=Borrelia miyamotoi TaxID=47466 RepID=UPI000B8D56D2|nr:p23 cell envelope protein [Borrelia miyamotoi]ASQ29673.1 p23 cell envelope protein [Borrelia miyamotoi]